jgi:hypothetical protein
MYKCICMIMLILTLTSTSSSQSNKQVENETLSSNSLIPIIESYPDTSPETMKRWDLYYKIDKKLKDGKISFDNLTEDEKDLVTECELFSSPWDISSPGCSWYCNGTIHEVFASSFLESEGGHTYDPENIADECLDTVWAEGVPGSGIGESVTYRVSGPISGISIYNGYGKTDELFLNNNRVKKLRVLIAEKTEYIIELFDIRNEQVIFLESNKYENVTIKFEILDVYRGLKYDDTCVSEIQFLGGH